MQRKTIKSLKSNFWLILIVTVVLIVIIKGFFSLSKTDNPTKLYYEPYLFFKENNVFYKEYEKGRKYRILLLGGSTAGLFPTQELEKSFGRYLKRDVEIINFAQSGYRSEQELIMLVLYGVNVRPDMILLISGANDALRALVNIKGLVNNPQGKEGFLRVVFLQAVLQKIKVLKRLNNRYTSRTQSKVFQKKEFKEKIAGNYFKNMRAMMLVAKGLDIPFVLVLQPYIHFNQNISEEVFAKLKKRGVLYRKSFVMGVLGLINKRLQALKYKKLFYFNASALFRNAEPGYFKDEIHLNEGGYRAFAKTIIRFLEEERKDIDLN